MSIEANITPRSELHRWEAKFIDVEVFEDDGVTPKDISAVDLAWRLIHHGIILEKTTVGGGITVIGVNNNIAHIALEAPDDYVDIVAGVYRHELWDTDNNLQLVHGSLWLLIGYNEPVAP